MGLFPTKRTDEGYQHLQTCAIITTLLCHSSTSDAKNVCYNTTTHPLGLTPRRRSCPLASTGCRPPMTSHGGNAPSQPTVETAIRGARGYVRLVARPEWLVVFGPSEASIFAHNAVNGSFKLG